MKPLVRTVQAEYIWAIHFDTPPFAKSLALRKLSKRSEASSLPLHSMPLVLNMVVEPGQGLIRGCLVGLGDLPPSFGAVLQGLNVRVSVVLLSRNMDKFEVLLTYSLLVPRLDMACLAKSNPLYSALGSAIPDLLNRPLREHSIQSRQLKGRLLTGRYCCA